MSTPPTSTSEDPIPTEWTLEWSPSLSHGNTNDEDISRAVTPESYLESDPTFDIFVEYTLYSQKIIDSFIGSIMNKHHHHSLLHRHMPDTLRALIFKYFFIRKQNEVERLLLVGRVMLSKSLTMAYVKKTLCDEFDNKIPPPSKRLRLRHIEASELQIDIVEDAAHEVPLIHTVYYDDLTLGENCEKLHKMNANNKFQICCQILSHEETFTQKNVLLRCLRVYPITTVRNNIITKEWIFEEFVEIAFHRNDSKKMIQNRLCEQYASDCQSPNLRISIQELRRFEKKIKQYRNNQIDFQRLFFVENSIPLVFPLYACEHCDVLLFTDSSELLTNV